MLSRWSEAQQPVAEHASSDLVGAGMRLVSVHRPRRSQNGTSSVERSDPIFGARRSVPAIRRRARVRGAGSPASRGKSACLRAALPSPGALLRDTLRPSSVARARMLRLFFAAWRLFGGAAISGSRIAGVTPSRFAFFARCLNDLVGMRGKLRTWLFLRQILRHDT